MKVNTKISTFIGVFVLAGLLLPLISANVSYAGAPPMPQPKPGCCTTESGAGMCVACPEGETCQTSQDFCEFEGGFFQPGACSDDGGEFLCENKINEAGCCVVEPGSCIDEISSGECFIEVSASSDLWVDQTACSVVPQCTPTRNIPTMSNWGLIALAGIFILVGLWAITRKKATA